MKLIAGVFLCAAAFAADPAGVHYWSASELKGFDKKLSPKIDSAHFASQQFGDLGKNSLAMIAHREGDGSAEIHETQNDIFVVENGEATLVLGGQTPGAKQTAPNELRAPKIEGGTTRKLSAGDVIYIPAKMPHQLLIPKGSHFTYFVVKVKD